jgi:hypothetical protein
MDGLRYEDIGPVSHIDAEAAFESARPETIATTLIALGLHGDDIQWIQEKCLSYLTHTNQIVVSAAIVSLGHAARANRTIDKQVVVPALRALAGDPRYAGRVQDALDDIETFVRL